MEFTAKVQDGEELCGTKNTYYDNTKDNTAFERCIDIMSRLILKYGPDMFEKLALDNISDIRCEETYHVL